MHSTHSTIRYEWRVHTEKTVWAVNVALVKFSSNFFVGPNGCQNQQCIFSLLVKLNFIDFLNFILTCLYTGVFVCVYVCMKCVVQSLQCYNKIFDACLREFFFETMMWNVCTLKSFSWTNAINHKALSAMWEKLSFPRSLIKCHRTPILSSNPVSPSLLLS